MFWWQLLIQNPVPKLPTFFSFTSEVLKAEINKVADISQTESVILMSQESGGVASPCPPWLTTVWHLLNVYP